MLFVGNTVFLFYMVDGLCLLLGLVVFFFAIVFLIYMVEEWCTCFGRTGQLLSVGHGLWTRGAQGRYRVGTPIHHNNTLDRPCITDVADLLQVRALLGVALRCYSDFGRWH